MQNLQFIQVTPEQLIDTILKGVKDELQELRDQIQSTHQENESDYVTRQEVAQRLRIDISTVHNWTKKGTLKPYGIGNRVYYKWAEIEEAIIKF